jgi:hypothetical protein
MTDTDLATLTGLTAVGESLSPAAPATTAVATRSQGQYLLDRFTDQCNRMLALHRRLLELRSHIVAGPAPSASLAKVEEPRKANNVAFFAGLGTVADANDLATHALEVDIDELTKLF